MDPSYFFIMNIYNCRFLKPLNINAIVLYPFILYYDKKPLEEIMRHESVHIDQIKKNGVVKFYSRYLTEYCQGRWQGLNHYQAYRNISFEREAYGDPDHIA